MKCSNNKNSKYKKPLICSKCKSKDIVKRGLRKTKNRGKVQRYGCNSCGHRFITDPFARMRNSPQKITCALDLFYRGLSTRGVQEHFKAFFPHNSDHSTIYRWIRKYSVMISKYTNGLKLSVGAEVQIDEVEYHRRKSHKAKLGNDKNWFIDSICPKTKFMVASEYVKSRGMDEIKAVIKDIKTKTEVQVKVITTDGLMAYPRVLRKTWNLNKHATRNPKIIHNVTIGSSGRFNYKIERFHNTLRERTKIMRGFHGCITSAQTLMKGYEIYYNWIRNNMALKGQTPSQIAVPNVQIENKNGWLELIQRGYDGI